MTARAKNLARVELLFVAVGLCALSACGGHSVNLDQAGIETPTYTGTAGDTIALPDELMALWVDDSRLYWTSATFKFQSCIKDSCSQTITTYLNQQAIDVAIGGGHVYWNVINDAENIYSCPSSGCDGAPTRVVEDPSLGAISADGDYVYWASASDIYRCRYSGCGPTPELVTAQETSGKLAFQGSDAFWAQEGSAFGEPPSIRRAPKDGSAPASTFLHTQTFSIATGATSLYWISNDYADTVASCPLAGCGSTGPAVLATSPGRDDKLQLNASGMYWVDIEQGAGQSAVHSCPLTGCGTNIETLTPTGVISFAVDDSYVYWLEMDPHQSYAGKNIHRTSK